MADYSKLYLIPGDGVINPPTTYKGTWNSTSSAQNVWIDGVPDRSANSARAASEAVTTNPFDVAIMRCCSRPLVAQTISGTLDYVLGLLESAAGALFVTKIHAYIRVGETDAVRGTLLSNFVDSLEWPTTSTGKSFGAGPQTLTAVDAEDGDTLVIEIGYRSTNTTGTSRTGTIRRGCMTADAGFTAEADLTVGSTSTTTLAGYFSFSNALSFQELTNDAWVNATVLTGAFTETLSLRPAIREDDEAEPCSGSALNTRSRYNSIFYTWTCPADQSVTVSADILNGASTFDTCLMVLTGTPGSFVTVDCRSENDPSFESITFAATMGVTYTIQISTVYYGGGDLTFTFTPSAPPVADETILPAVINSTNDFATATAMGWVNLIADNAVTRHFWYAGAGFTPFVPGDAYVWLGTATDGRTLTLNIYDGTTLTVVPGPFLELNLYYHWIYVKDGDTHRVYLSTDPAVDSPSLDLDLVIDVDQPLSLVPGVLGARQFVYAAAATLIPKAFKTWTTALGLSLLADERDSYAVVTKTGVTNVVKFQTDTTGSASPNYSGYGFPIGPPLAGGGEDWEIIRGPSLPTLPSRPFADDFESYASGAYTGVSPFVGVVDAARAYEYFTDPSFANWIQGSVGLAGSQAFVTRQASADIWFEHDSYTGRCGSVSLWSYKHADVQPALDHGAAITIEPTPDGGLTDPDVAGFGFLDAASGGAAGPNLGDQSPSPLYFFNHWDGTTATVPDVYILGQWQFIQFFFELSTVAVSQTDVNADGSITILVDGRVVLTLDGLKLTVDDSGWTSDRNTWDTVGLSWGGYLDGLVVGTVCFAAACPGLRGAPRTGA